MSIWGWQMSKERKTLFEKKERFKKEKNSGSPGKYDIIEEWKNLKKTILGISSQKRQGKRLNN